MSWISFFVQLCRVAEADAVYDDGTWVASVRVKIRERETAGRNIIGYLGSVWTPDGRRSKVTH